MSNKTGVKLNKEGIYKKLFGDENQQNAAKKREKKRREGYDMTGLVPVHMYNKNAKKVLEHIVGEKNVNEMLGLISGVKNGLVVNTCPMGMREYVDFATGKKQCTWEQSPKDSIQEFLKNGTVVRSGILSKDCEDGKEPMVLANGIRICFNPKSAIAIPPTITDENEISRILTSAEKVKRIFHEIALDKKKARKINTLLNSAPTLRQLRSVVMDYDQDPESAFLRKFIGALSTDIDIHNAQNMLYEISTQMPGFYAEPQPSTSDYLKFFGIKVVGGKSGGKKHKKPVVGGAKKKRPAKTSVKKPAATAAKKHTEKKTSESKKKEKQITSVNISDKTFIVTDDIDDVTDLLID